jgi:hypothetical protein
VYNWNVQLVAREDRDQFITCIDTLPWDIVMIQEWCQRSTFHRQLTKHGHVLITNDNSAGAGWGCALLVHRKWARSIVRAQDGFRCLSVDVVLHGVEVCFTTAHLPANGDDEQWSNCVDSCYQISSHAKRNVLGVDANTELPPNLEGVTGPFIQGAMYPWTQYLLDLLYGLRLRVPSTFEERKVSEQLTHYHHAVLCRQIDFFCASSNIRVRATSKVEGLDYISDHTCEHMEIILNVTKPEVSQKRRRVNVNWKCFEPNRYKEELCVKLDPLYCAEVSRIGDFADVISEVAGVHIKKLGRRQELDATINALRNIKRTTLDLGTRRILSRQIWSLQKQNKNERFQEQLKKQVDFRVGWGKKSEALCGWRDLPFLRGVDGAVLGSSDGVREFEKMYTELYKEQEPLNPEINIWCTTTSAHFDRLDVETVIGSMKTGVSPGLDLVTVEMLRHADDRTLALLAEWFNSRFSGDFDDSWSPILVTLIPKTGNANRVSAYRPISLLSTLYKAFELLLMKRMPPNIQGKMDELHFGFRTSYQALESISIARLVAEKALEIGSSLVVCKTDVAKAFDTLSHNTIIDSLRYYGVEDDVICAILREIRGNQMMLRTPDGLFSKRIPQTRGVRQGGTLSPLIFVLALSYIMHDLIIDWQNRGMGYEHGGSLFEFVCALVFADDILLFAKTWTEMKIMLREVVETLGKHGLNIQGDKCCSMANEYANDENELRLKFIAKKKVSNGREVDNHDKATPPIFQTKIKKNAH